MKKDDLVLPPLPGGCTGSICIGCHWLILPPVPPGATRGLSAAVAVADIPWVA